MQIDQENEERRVIVENWSKLSSKIRTTEPQPKITGSYKKSIPPQKIPPRNSLFRQIGSSDTKL